MLAAALFVVAGGVAVSRLVDLRAANAAVEHTLLVRADTEALSSLLKDAETAVRGYIITGDEAHIQLFDEAATQLPMRITAFRMLTADNPRQQQYITQFENLASRRIEQLRRGIALRRSKGFDLAHLPITGEGKRVMDAARDVIAQMQTEEDRLWHERGLEQREQATRTAAISIGALAIAVVLLVMATLYVTRR